MNALEIKGVSKSFSGFCLDNLNLTLPSGCIMGLVGENGAGKSTTIKLILDILHKDSGIITVLGRDNEKDIALIKEDVGVVMDEVGIPECLTVNQVGKIMKHTFRNWNDAEYSRLIKKLSLPENKQFKDFSRGMKMKLGIAIAMSHGAKLLLLDEPTLALDPRNRRMVIRALGDLPCAKLIATHDLDFVLDSCSRVIVVSDGMIVAEGAPAVILRNRELLESNGLELPLSQTSRCQ